jgi:hypothetical protein
MRWETGGHDFIGQRRKIFLDRFTGKAGPQHCRSRGVCAFDRGEQFAQPGVTPSNAMQRSSKNHGTNPSLSSAAMF